MNVRTFLSFILLLSFSAIFPLNGETYSELAEIEASVIMGDFDEAKALAEQYIKGKPPAEDMNQALYYLAVSQLRLTEYAAARDTFKRLLKRTKNKLMRDKASIGIIDSIYLQGDYKTALKKAKQLLKQRPHSPVKGLIYLKIASANLKLARWKEAENYLKRIVQEFPGSIEAHRARQLTEEKRFFSVQVGAFLDQNRAARLARDLKKNGEYAYIVETVDEQQRKFYRVRVGEFTRLEEAQKLKNQLTKQGYPTKIYP